LTIFEKSKKEIHKKSVGKRVKKVSKNQCYKINEESPQALAS
jgi:hypothetical protein